MRRRVLSITLVISFCLLAAHPTFADTIDFQTAVGSGGGAQTQSGGGTTASQVQTVDFGDVTGTVCDCGEIAPGGESAPGEGASKGGFPKFPLFALAVLPIFFPPDNPPPSSPPNPPEVPEPLTLATLAAGLAAFAGLRARRVK